MYCRCRLDWIRHPQERHGRTSSVIGTDVLALMRSAGCSGDSSRGSGARRPGGGGAEGSCDASVSASSGGVSPVRSGAARSPWPIRDAVSTPLRALVYERGSRADRGARNAGSAGGPLARRSPGTTEAGPIRPRMTPTCEGCAPPARDSCAPGRRTVTTVTECDCPLRALAARGEGVDLSRWRAVFQQFMASSLLGHVVDMPPR